jgi:hypothetical protein
VTLVVLLHALLLHAAVRQCQGHPVSSLAGAGVHRPTQEDQLGAEAVVRNLPDPAANRLTCNKSGHMQV